MAGQVTGCKDEYQLANNCAFKLLARCDRSKGELREKLLKKGCSAEVLEDVLDQLETKGYVNDCNFAYRFAIDAVRRKTMGPNGVREYLKKKHISKEIIEDTISRVYKDCDEREVALSALNRKRIYQRLLKSEGEQDLTVAEKRKEIRRLSDYLRRKGFSYDIIRKTIKEIREEGNDI